MSLVARPRAVFGVKKKDVPGVIVRAQTMASAMMAHAATFASPTVAMVAFLALIAALTDAQQHALATKARGAAKLRDSKRDAVWTAMDSLQSYVQGLADVLSAQSAASVIEMAGLLVAKTGSYQKALLTATLTTTPGVVHLDANVSLLVGAAGASKKVVFHWQVSADGGATWNDVEATAYGSTDVAGLALMARYSFRARVTIARVPGPWSQAVSLVVY